MDRLHLGAPWLGVRARRFACRCTDPVAPDPLRRPGCGSSGCGSPGCVDAAGTGTGSTHRRTGSARLGRGRSATTSAYHWSSSCWRSVRSASNTRDCSSASPTICLARLLASASLRWVSCSVSSSNRACRSAASSACRTASSARARASFSMSSALRLATCSR
ncbi:hypothetical protein BBK82_29760 [Lentzea guizhouensis]|uniref:Uncharacterized protein n=1 Tax=Lentzea guizhouensis TaxID=1586287 RepID=A0A1B2HPH2_9PSEU|nr:hypothetical protein BBK82_29760 [Lentzea guizhouensis]